MFKPSGHRHGPLRQRFEIPDAAKVVGFVGRLSIEKGPACSSAWRSHSTKHDPGLHFLMVGDGPMRAQLEAIDCRLQARQRRVSAGLQESMADIYCEMDLFVSSSRSEAMPLAVMEAMASGLPTVATGVGGILELVQQGRTGWLVAEGDYEGLAARARSLLGDEVALQAAGVNARQRAVRKFALMDSVAAVTSLWQRLAQQRGDALRLVAAPAEAPWATTRRHVPNPCRRCGRCRRLQRIFSALPPWRVKRHLDLPADPFPFPTRMRHPVFPFRSFWMGGYEGADHVNADGLPLDMADCNAHMRRLDEDYANAAARGLGCVARASVGAWTNALRASGTWPARGASRSAPSATAYR